MIPTSWNEEEEKVGKGREGLQRRPLHSCSRKAASEILTASSEHFRVRTQASQTQLFIQDLMYDRNQWNVWKSFWNSQFLRPEVRGKGHSLVHSHPPLWWLSLHPSSSVYISPFQDQNEIPTACYFTKVYTAHAFEESKSRVGSLSGCKRGHGTTAKEPESLGATPSPWPGDTPMTKASD